MGFLERWDRWEQNCFITYNIIYVLIGELWVYRWGWGLLFGELAGFGELFFLGGFSASWD